MKKILVNKAQCLKCGDIIESKYRHDMVWCSCRDEDGNPSGIAVDGGRDYLKRAMGKDFDERYFRDLSEEQLYFEGEEED